MFLFGPCYGMYVVMRMQRLGGHRYEELERECVRCALKQVRAAAAARNPLYSPRNRADGDAALFSLGDWVRETKRYRAAVGREVAKKSAKLPHDITLRGRFLEVDRP